MIVNLGKARRFAKQVVKAGKHFLEVGQVNHPAEFLVLIRRATPKPQLPKRVGRHFGNLRILVPKDPRQGGVRVHRSEQSQCKDGRAASLDIGMVQEALQGALGILPIDTMTKHPQAVMHPGGPQVGVVRREQLGQFTIESDKPGHGHGVVPRTQFFLGVCPVYQGNHARSTALTSDFSNYVLR